MVMRSEFQEKFVGKGKSVNPLFHSRAIIRCPSGIGRELTSPEPGNSGFTPAARLSLVGLRSGGPAGRVNEPDSLDLSFSARSFFCLHDPRPSDLTTMASAPAADC
jgi:hypothetical protein